LAAMTLGDDLWSDFTSYQFNGEPDSDDHAAKELELLVQETPVGEYGELEGKLIAVLKAEHATLEAKTISCRFLQQVGSDQCVPALSKYLSDPDLSHFARLVLERLQTSAARQALRAALSPAPDSLKPGIMGSLAKLQDRSAVDIVGQIAQADDPALALAAMQALGAIGGDRAAGRLAALNPPEELEYARLTALIHSAATLDKSRQVALAETVLAGDYPPARIAALRTIAQADPAAAAKLLAEFIRGDDYMMRTEAITIISDPEVSGLTSILLASSEDVPSAVMPRLLTALGTRGDPQALPLLRKSIRSGDDAIRTAAIQSIGKIGDAASAELLLAMEDSSKDGELILKTLVSMSDSNVDSVLINALKQSSARELALAALAGRGVAEAVPAMLELVTDSSATTRNQVWDAIGRLDYGDNIATIMKNLIAVEDPRERASAITAVKRICTRAIDKQACIGIVAEHFDTADDTIKAELLGLGAITGDANALSMLRKAIASGNPDLFDKALRTFGAWPNESAADDLLQIARKGGTELHRHLALRAYIRIAALDDAKLSDSDRLAMFKAADALAESHAEKQRIAGGLVKARRAEALDMLAAYMENEELAEVAAISAASLVWDLRLKNTEKSRQMAEILKDSKNESVAKKAQSTLAFIAQRQGE
jgi:HEAT repeat protein